MAARRGGGRWRRREDVAEQWLRRGASLEDVRAAMPDLDAKGLERARRRVAREQGLPEPALERAGKRGGQ